MEGQRQVADSGARLDGPSDGLGPHRLIAGFCLSIDEAVQFYQSQAQFFGRWVKLGRVRTDYIHPRGIFLVEYDRINLASLGPYFMDGADSLGVEFR